MKLDTADLIVENKDLRGWAAIRLIAAICNRDVDKLANLCEAITANYTELEVKSIWRQCKSILTSEEIAWLESNLKQLANKRCG